MLHHFFKTKWVEFNKTLKRTFAKKDFRRFANYLFVQSAKLTIKLHATRREGTVSEKNKANVPSVVRFKKNRLMCARHGGG